MQFLHLSPADAEAVGLHDHGFDACYPLRPSGAVAQISCTVTGARCPNAANGNFDAETSPATRPGDEGQGWTPRVLPAGLPRRPASATRPMIPIRITPAPHRLTPLEKFGTIAPARFLSKGNTQNAISAYWVSLVSWYSISVFTCQRLDLSTTPAAMLSTAIIAVSME